VKNDDFYVGYLPKAPEGLSAVLRQIVLALLAIGTTLAVSLVFAQTPFPLSTFEFQNYKTFEGVLSEYPYPTLLGSKPYLLVAPGKHGAMELVTGLDGRTARLRGALIYRDGTAMIEALPNTIQPSPDPSVRPAPAIDLGQVTLDGEIVDSKCYLGVMNPGNGKVHRDCAARCLSGGIPPAFVVKDASGVSKTLVLSYAGRFHEFVAEPVEISGRLLRSNGMFELRADPGSIRRLGQRE
jgi:hypothetical protein